MWTFLPQEYIPRDDFLLIGPSLQIVRFLNPSKTFLSKWVINSENLREMLPKVYFYSQGLLK
jgi:hypothetical protein